MQIQYQILYYFLIATMLSCIRYFIQFNFPPTKMVKCHICSVLYMFRLVFMFIFRLIYFRLIDTFPFYTCSIVYMSHRVMSYSAPFKGVLFYTWSVLYTFHFKDILSYTCSVLYMIRLKHVPSFQCSVLYMFCL
jgi:hypothetical protein